MHATRNTGTTRQTVQIITSLMDELLPLSSRKNPAIQLKIGFKRISTEG